jgi:hypothetical protein
MALVQVQTAKEEIEQIDAYLNVNAPSSHSASNFFPSDIKEECDRSKKNHQRS